MEFVAYNSCKQPEDVSNILKASYSSTKDIARLLVKLTAHVYKLVIWLCDLQKSIIVLKDQETMTDKVYIYSRPKGQAAGIVYGRREDTPSEAAEYEDSDYEDDSPPGPGVCSALSFLRFFSSDVVFKLHALLP